MSKLFDGPVIRIDKTGTYFHRTMEGINVGQESKVSSVWKGHGLRDPETERPHTGMEAQPSKYDESWRLTSKKQSGER